MKVLVLDMSPVEETKLFGGFSESSVIMVGMFLSASLCQADCARNARGKTLCSDGQSAAAYNPNTGKGATANKNQNGVTTTQTRRPSPRPFYLEDLCEE